MILTNLSQYNTSLFYYDEVKNAEIRSIDEVFPEYTSCSTSNKFNDNVKDIIYELINNVSIDKLPYSTNTDWVSGVAMQKYYKGIREVKLPDHLYKFDTVFIYSIKKEDECIIAENEFFNIFGYGNTVEDAEKELFEYINDLWECYVEENDENLDESAILLKQKLLNSIRKVY